MFFILTCPPNNSTHTSGKQPCTYAGSLTDQSRHVGSHRANLREHAHRLTRPVCSPPMLSACSTVCVDVPHRQHRDNGRHPEASEGCNHASESRIELVRPSSSKLDRAIAPSVTAMAFASAIVAVTPPQARPRTAVGEHMLAAISRRAHEALTSARARIEYL